MKVENTTPGFSFYPSLLFLIALLTPSIYPELTGQEMNPVEEIPVAVKPNPNKTIDESTVAEIM